MTHVFFPDRPVDELGSMASLANGGLPFRAQRRIFETRSAERPIFTSTLTASESVVVSQAGLEPVSQVMGSSIYHVGYRSLYSSWAGGELTNLSRAYEHARSLALSRMQQEAAMLGTHVVLDVKFLIKGYSWAEDLLEFTAVGTALRARGAPPTDKPVLTLLEPDELLKLQHAGYWPVGIAIGNCFWYEPHADCRSEGSWYSAELPVHSRAAMTARHVAVDRFHQFAKYFNADGVVGVKVERRGRDFEYENMGSHTGFELDLVVMGTAVVRRNQPQAVPRPRLVLDLRDLPKRDPR